MRQIRYRGQTYIPEYKRTNWFLAGVFSTLLVVFVFDIVGWL